MVRQGADTRVCHAANSDNGKDLSERCARQRFMQGWSGAEVARPVVHGRPTTSVTCAGSDLGVLQPLLRREERLREPPACGSGAMYCLFGAKPSFYAWVTD